MNVFVMQNIPDNAEENETLELEYRFKIKEVCRLKFPVGFGFSPGDKRAGDGAV